jgi:hypothetical protein
MQRTFAQRDRITRLASRCVGTCELQGVWTHNLGYHAFKDREQAQHQASEHICDWVVVVGSVNMWGEVIEHQHGWRSEYAAVRSIIKITGNRDFSSKQQLRQLLFDLREMYGCRAVATEL